MSNLRGERHSAASWASSNPVLDDGDIGQERDTRKVKVGDGSTAWNSLPYLSTSGGGDVAGWDEYTISTDSADWVDDEVGTWTFDAGVISQTDATADSRLTLLVPIPVTVFVIEADIRIPTGQDSGTAAKAIVAGGCLGVPEAGSTNVLGEGLAVGGASVGDGDLNVSPLVDGNASLADDSAAWPAGFGQDEWHTIRAVVNGVRQSIYVDGVYVMAGETVSGGNIFDFSVPMKPDLVMLGAVGLADFRDITLWTHKLPS